MKRKVYYENFSDACAAVRKLNCKTVTQYRKCYRLDPLLPSNPDRIYKEWSGWVFFCCGYLCPEKYDDFNKAKVAVRKLKIKTSKEYRYRYSEDPHLPVAPYDVYLDEWRGWKDFLATEARESNFYKSFDDAKAAAIKIGFRSCADYRLRYMIDPFLPSSPYSVYASRWGGWKDFLNYKKTDNFYDTYSEASDAALRICIISAYDYISRHKLDSRLPSHPQRRYISDWVSWPSFLQRKVRGDEFYKSLEEASHAAVLLGATSRRSYMADFKKDWRLPANPDHVYKNSWRGWYEFLQMPLPKTRFYKTIELARAATQILKISSSNDYAVKYRLDPLLPSNPHKVYSKWTNWFDFLGYDDQSENFYRSIFEASAAAVKLGLTSVGKYSEGYKQDIKLPSAPNMHYRNDWIDWNTFLCKRAKYYESIRDARRAVAHLRIDTSTEYFSNYKKDARLPSAPWDFYSEWQGWISYLLPVDYLSLEDVKRAVKILKIKNSKGYRAVYKKHPPLPANPDRVFSLEWESWYELCCIQRPCSYEEAREIVNGKGIISQAAYKKFSIDEPLLRLPRHPEEAYREWTNWYVFFGTPEPFRCKYLPEKYHKWASCITSFMKEARGGASKESFLCKFVRMFIIENDLGDTPESFLCREIIDIKPFKVFLESLASENLRRGMLNAVNEFLNHIISSELTVEDEITGELVTVAAAKNPFLAMVLTGEGDLKPGETSKRALAYQFVESARDWIIPKEAKTYSDLKHIQKFEADWIEVEPVKIDSEDPDCVFKTENGKTKIWFPGYWMHTYALMSVPARGRQIAYSDSGEADEFVTCIKDFRLEWELNDSRLEPNTANQSFIKRYEGDQFGMHFTTNKTSNHGQGYSVPWVPVELVYWVTRFRNWQRKYNAISKPMAWLKCKRTDLNEIQRKAKGSNCFLFRDFGYEEPGYYGGRLTHRLAAALYFSQSKSIVLATLVGNPNTLGFFKSPYTPHSMRVSLITAYVEEFGLPIEIVMKVAGHTSIVMSLYYVKVGASHLRQRFSEGEKLALKNKAYALQSMIEQGRVDSIKTQLVANSEHALKIIATDNPAGSYLFRDYGICPFAGTRCGDGGPNYGHTQVYHPVPAGYLGFQNCPRCRHFVTGPAFAGGLLSLANEISLQARNQYRNYDDLETLVASLRSEIEALDTEEYTASLQGLDYDGEKRAQLELRLRKIRSESESSAKKLDVFMCDLQAICRLLKQSHALVGNGVDDSSAEGTVQLIVHRDHELFFQVEDSASYFQQLCEVCENALIYESASADSAIAPRSQMIDKMSHLNGLDLNLYLFDEKQQLLIGNQVSKLLLSRLKSWGKVDKLMNGHISIADLSPEESITLKDFDEIFYLRSLNLIEGDS